MIARIDNLPEVERAIRADGAFVAKNAEGTFLDLHGHARKRALSEAVLIGKLSSGRVSELPGFELSRLACVWLIAYATEMEMNLGELQQVEINSRASALRCQVCHEPDAHSNHFRPRPMISHLHVFVCHHGKEVGEAKDCITDHPDIVPAEQQPKEVA